MKLPNYDHVPPKTVRFWAMFDTGVMSLALPFTSPFFISFLYWLNGLIGGGTTAPAFDPLAMFFVNLAGMLVLKGVAENDLRPASAQFGRRHRLHRAVGAHRHELRRLDAAARKVQTAAPGGALGGKKFETHGLGTADGSGMATIIRHPAAMIRVAHSPPSTTGPAPR